MRSDGDQHDARERQGDPESLRAGEALAPRLLAQQAIARYVRRIATVRLVSTDSVIDARVRLAWEAAAP